MRLSFGDKTIEENDFDIVMKTNKHGNLECILSLDGVFSVELTELDTRRLSDALHSAVKMIIDKRSGSCAQKKCC